MIEKNVCKMYKDGNSMRSIVIVFNTNHKMISRILKRNNIEKRATLNLIGIKKFECNVERLYNNMATHLRFDVSIDWLIQFSNFDKMKLLNNIITNRSGRWDVSTEWYRSYIIKFYEEINFNDIYNKWVKSGFDKYMKPSIDHIIPKSKGGLNNIDNLQFLTWFENRCKNNMNQDQWNDVKLNIKEYFKND